MSLTIRPGVTIGAGISLIVPPTSSPTPTYSFDSIPTSINEDTAGTFNIVTTNVLNGTILYWTIATNSGDFGNTSGSFTITSGAGSFAVTPTADSTTEGAETFTVTLRTDSITGPIVATSNTVTINDTSLTPIIAGVNNVTGYDQITTSPPPTYPEDFGNPDVTVNGTIGFTFNSPGGTNGLAMTNLTSSNLTWFDTHPLPTTVTWGPGSTVASSAITIDYYGPGPNGKALVIRIVGQTGSATYNYPFIWS